MNSKRLRTKRKTRITFLRMLKLDLLLQLPKTSRELITKISTRLVTRDKGQSSSFKDFSEEEPSRI